MQTALESRLDALVVARAQTSRTRTPDELAAALARYAPPEQTAAAWQDQLIDRVEQLRARAVLGPDLRPRDAGQLARMIGKHAARTWPQLADRVLPALGLGLAAADKHLARLAGRDAWAAAIAARALGLWDGAGPPPALPALCDALAWQRLALPGRPKRCPPEIRAVFVQRELAPEVAGPPDRLVRLLAAREVGAPRPELRALLDALVRGWLAGRLVGATAGFADEVRTVARGAHAGVFGDRKVFIASVWDELRRRAAWSSLTLDDFKARLVAAHRAGDLALARADLVAAMDPELVAASETTTDGASFHFVVREHAS